MKASKRYTYAEIVRAGDVCVSIPKSMFEGKDGWYVYAAPWREDGKDAPVARQGWRPGVDLFWVNHDLEAVVDFLADPDTVADPLAA